MGITAGRRLSRRSRFAGQPSIDQRARNLRAAGRATIDDRGETEEVVATELDTAQRVAFFRDVLGPFARSMRGGVAFVRVIDQTDLDDPVGAAEGRAVFELRPTS